MKILQVTPEYPPYNLGGGGVLVQNLSKALSKKGYDLTVAAGYYPVKGLIDKPFQYRVDNFVVEWLPLWPTINLGFQLKTILPPNIPAFIKMLKIFLKHDFDIVHIHGFGHGICDLASILCKITHKPYIVTSHGLPKEPERAGGMLRIIYQAYFTTLGAKLIERAEQVVAVSKSGEKEIKQWFPQKKTAIIQNALELKGYFPISKTKIKKLLAKYNLVGKEIILCIGRLSIAKGFDYAVHALPNVINKIPNAHLLVIGKDDGYGYFNKLKDAVNKDNMEGHVTFLGEVTDVEKKIFFGAASVVLIPSIVEVFGLVALEALAARKPIVASRLGGLVEILSATPSSTLVEPRNSSQLSNALIAVLSKKEIYYDADTNELVNLDQFDPKTMVNSYVNLYQGIIHNHP